MSGCSVVRERMPDLLVEALDAAEREQSHIHIERCAACESEWRDFRESWDNLGALPEVLPPARLRTSFLAQAAALDPRSSNVVPFVRRPAIRWAAQAAAVAVLVGGGFFAGRTTPAQPDFSTPATVAAISTRGNEQIQRVSYPIAESMVLPASQVNPDIQGRPDIQNVRFFQDEKQQIGISFDLTSHVTLTGDRDDKSLVNVLTYVLQNGDNSIQARSNAIQWVKDTYAGPTGSPDIARALANILKNDTHEGVRIKAVEAINSMTAPSLPETRNALIEALKNDPNPAVRMKAVDALAKLTAGGNVMHPEAVKTLREKASQTDENVYVRVKAAEALSQIDL